MNVTSTITLCGQTTNTTITAGAYNIKDITVISGQNLTFSRGEYMTIAFHSSGSTSSFYQSAATAADQRIAYTSTANYASAGFPATLTSTSISTALAIKICFELY